MKPINEITADQVMNTKPVTVSISQSLSQIKNVMEENQIRTIPVLDNQEKFAGAISYRDLIRYIQFNPEKTKVKKVMHQPPEFKKDDSVVKLADLRINSGKKMLVKTNGDKLAGTVSDKEFVEAFRQTEELRKITTEELQIRELVTVFEEDSIEEARHKMLDKNISRVPVLDKNGKLEGLIKSTDLLKTMVPRERVNSGGTSGSRKGNEVKIAGGIEKERMSEIPIKELVRTEFLTISEHIKGSEAAEKMVEEDQEEIIFTEDNYPRSIISVKDLIDYAADFAPGKTILVNLTGLDVPEEKSAVHNKIRTQIQGSLGRKIKRPKELRMRIKKHDKDGKRNRYEIDTRLDCEYGLIKVDEEGWDLLDTVDSALEQLNTIVRKKKEKKSEHR